MWCFLVYSRRFAAPFAMSPAFQYQEVATYIYSKASHSCDNTESVCICIILEVSCIFEWKLFQRSVIRYSTDLEISLFPHIAAAMDASAAYYAGSIKFYGDGVEFSARIYPKGNLQNQIYM